MQKRRRRLILGLVTSIGVLLGAYGAHEWYYRSDYYRARIEGALAAFFGLPADLESIRPTGLSSRELINLQIWLPERRARIFTCPRAIWDASKGNGNGTVLHLYDSVMTIGSEDWKSEDYMRVLKASLLHNFSDLNIKRVQFYNGRIDWPRRNLQIRADGVHGVVDFDEKGQGRAVLTSRSLNNVEVTAPIQISALIDPANEQDFLPEVSLVVPPLPLSALGLDHVLESPVTQGSFSGKITLMQSPGADTIEFNGVAKDVLLDEFTRRVQGGPVAGLVELTIHKALVHGHTLESLRFNAQAREVVADPMLRRFGLPEIGGTMRLEVLNGWVQNETVQGMIISGDWQGGSLEALTQPLLQPAGIHGQVSVNIKSLVLKDNELVSGEIDVHALPAPGRSSTIPKSTLLDALARYLNFTMPEWMSRMLPNSVEFVQAQAKLLIDGRTLRILPLANPGNHALLTVRVAGQELPLVRNVDQTFDLTPWIERAQERAGQLKEKLKKRRDTASQPAASQGG